MQYSIKYMKLNNFKILRFKLLQILNYKTQLFKNNKYNLVS